MSTLSYSYYSHRYKPQVMHTPRVLAKPVLDPRPFLSPSTRFKLKINNSDLFTPDIGYVGSQVKCSVLKLVETNILVPL